jgi:transposase-like protein
MIDWTPVAQRLGYDTEWAMWNDLYVTRALSITQLAKKLDVSRNTVRSALDRLQIDIRRRGGPNNQKLEITDELIEEVKKDGVAAVAKKLGLPYSTLYKRLYRVKGLTVGDLHPEEPEPAQVEASDPTSEGDSLEDEIESPDEEEDA